MLVSNISALTCDLVPQVVHSEDDDEDLQAGIAASYDALAVQQASNRSCSPPIVIGDSSDLDTEPITEAAAPTVSPTAGERRHFITLLECYAALLQTNLMTTCMNLYNNNEAR